MCSITKAIDWTRIITLTWRFKAGDKRLFMCSLTKNFGSDCAPRILHFLAWRLTRIRITTNTAAELHFKPAIFPRLRRERATTGETEQTLCPRETVRRIFSCRGWTQPRER